MTKQQSSSHTHQPPWTGLNDPLKPQGPQVSKRKKLPLHVIKQLHMADEGEPCFVCHFCKTRYKLTVIRVVRDPDNWFAGERNACTFCVKDHNLNVIPPRR